MLLNNPSKLLLPHHVPPKTCIPSSFLHLRQRYIFLHTDDSIRQSYKSVEKQGFLPLADFFDNEKSSRCSSLLLCSCSGMQVTRAASCLCLDFGELQGCLTHSAYKTNQPKCFWHMSYQLQLHLVSFINNKNMENIHKVLHIPTSVLHKVYHKYLQHYVDEFILNKKLVLSSDN